MATKTVLTCQAIGWLAMLAILTEGGPGVSALAQDSGPWQSYPARSAAPDNAPNILLIMTDDVGFGAASSFGGLIETPVFDSIGEQGLRFNRFHTTAMCSPSRAALLTGRNHHAVGNGAITNLSRDLPGYTSVIPDSAATIADVLGEYGYVSAFLGKNHNTPEWEMGSMGPFDRWPTGLGFDYFYGFNAAWADQFVPELVENTTQVEPPADPAYILDRDLSDRAIEWLRRRENAALDAPFLIYLAPGSPHTPHHAPADWIARYEGRFDMGWDAARAMIFERQKTMGVIPADAVLTPRPAQLPAWDSLDEVEQRVAARMMEVYAAQLAFHDYQVGRILEELRRTGEYDNTLVIYLQGDNGGDMSSFSGESNEWGAFFGEEPDYHELAADLDMLGSREAWGGFPSAWAWATNAPFPWGKAVAGYLGGIRSGMAISWPARIGRAGVVVDRFSHITDIAPTIYEAVGIAAPDQFAGVTQLPIDGMSLVAEFGETDAADPARSQYFEMLGNFGFYEDGWFLGTTMQRPPWDRTSARTPIPDRLEDYDWELYNLSQDYSQSRDLSQENPAKLAEMIEGLQRVAQASNVFPVENDVMALLAPGMRPLALADRRAFAFTEAQRRYVAADVPPLRGRWRITGEVQVHEEGASGPIFTQGGWHTGWGLLLRNGHVWLANRPSFDRAKYGDAVSDTALSAGNHTVSATITPSPESGPYSAQVHFAIDGEAAGTARIPDARILAQPAYLQRFGLTRLREIQDVPATCQCTVDGVTLELLD